MKYKDFEGSIGELIDLKLKEIEEKEHVRILHAVESGSRAWGFASPDSDYDVRFIYVRSEEDYLKLQETRDFIDWELDETLDINGWDLQKVLRLFHKSNATLFEWANSPVIYRTTGEWANIYQRSQKYFSAKAAIYHYYGTANKNYHEYLTEEYVKYKKYFYVIRPLLACRWIEEKKCPPPVLFQTLLEETLDGTMRGQVDKLLEMKTGMRESEKGRSIQSLNRYIEKELDYYKELAGQMQDDRVQEWSELNELFLKSIR